MYSNIRFSYAVTHLLLVLTLKTLTKLPTTYPCQNGALMKQSTACRIANISWVIIRTRKLIRMQLQALCVGVRSRNISLLFIQELISLLGISGPSDTGSAVIGVCGVPTVTSCKDYEFAAKEITKNCMDSKTELVGGTYFLPDSKMTVLVYHVSMM